MSGFKNTEPQGSMMSIIVYERPNRGLILGHINLTSALLLQKAQELRSGIIKNVGLGNLNL